MLRKYLFWKWPAEKCYINFLESIDSISQLIKLSDDNFAQNIKINSNILEEFRMIEPQKLNDTVENWEQLAVKWILKKFKLTIGSGQLLYTGLSFQNCVCV